MASTKEYLYFVLEQLSELDEMEQMVYASGNLAAKSDKRYSVCNQSDRRGIAKHCTNI